MRIVMNASYPLDPTLVPGGVPAVAHYLVKGLGRINEIDLHVVCCQNDVPRDFVEQRDGATIHFLTSNYRFSQAMLLAPQRRKVGRLIREIDPHFVHAQGLGLPTVTTLDTGRPHLVSVHGVFWKEQFEHERLSTRIGSIIRKHSAKRQLARIENVVITSDYAASILPRGHNYTEYVIRNPVGEEIFAIENAPTRPHILVIGGLRRRKDPLTTMRVMEQVVAAMPEATLHLLGPPSGTEFDDVVRSYVAEHGLQENVKLLGLVPNEQLWAEYEQASLLLIPSLEETAPVSLGEACAVGLPAVGSDAGGIPSLIKEGETGFVRPVGNAEALAEAVLAVLQDDTLRARLAANARRFGADEFRLDAIARRHFEVYREIMNRV